MVREQTPQEVLDERDQLKEACAQALHYLENGAVFVAGEVETFDGVTRGDCIRSLRTVLGR